MYDFTGVTGAKVVIYDSSAAQSGKLLATADVVGAIANVAEGNTFTLLSGKLDASGVTVDGSGEGSFGAGINSLGKTYVHGGTVVGGQVNGDRVNHGGGGIAVSGANASLYMTGGNVEKGSATCGGAVLVQNSATFTMDGGYIYNGTAEYDGGNVFVWTATFNMNGGTIKDGVLGTNARYGTNVALHGINTFTMTGGTITGGSTTKSTAHGGVFVPAATKMTVSGNAKVNGNTVAGKASNLYLDASTLTIGGKGLTGTAKIGVTLGDGKGETSTSVTGVFTTGSNVTAAQKEYFTHDGGIGIVFGGNGTPLYCGKYGYQVGYAEEDYGEYCKDMGLSGYGNDAERKAESVDGYGLDIEVLVVTDDEGDTAVICSVEATTISTALHNKLRNRIAKDYGIPVNNIMISANHQHSTPVPGSTNQAYGNYTTFNKKFEALFMQAVAKAFKDRDYAEVYTKEVTTSGLNYIRNTKAYGLFSNNYLGMVSYNHTDLNVKDSFGLYSKVEEWAGDRNMQLVWFKRTTNKDIVVANFAVHPHGIEQTGSDSKVASSNFTGRFRSLVSNKYQCHTMYISGASGDVNMTYSGTLKYANGTNAPAAKTTLDKYAEAMLGYVPALSASKWDARSTGQVNAAAATVTLNTNKAKDNLYETAYAISSQTTLKAKESKWKELMDGVTDESKYIYSIYHADAIVNRHSEGATRNLQAYAISIGDISFAGGPYEMFSEDGRTIKNGDTHPATIMCFLANGHNGYLPSSTNWSNGGYSVDITYYAQGSSGTMNTKFIELLNQVDVAR